jgi:hypothetical protein
MKAMAIALLILMIGIAMPCFAGSNKDYINDNEATELNPHPKFALHMLAHGVGNCGKGLPVINNFNNIVRTWNSYTDVDAFMVIFDYDSMFVYEYTLEWPADWGSCSTVICGGSGIQNLKYTGDPGVAIFLDACAIGATKPFRVVAYHYFLPTSNGQIKIMPNGSTNNIGIVDCRTAPYNDEHWPDSLYYAGVNVDPYEGPPERAIQPTSWGAVKSLFR